MKKLGVKVSNEVESTILIPFVKELVEKCINLGFEVEDILETWQCYLRKLVRDMGANAPTDVRDIDFESVLDHETFLERLIEVASDRQDEAVKLQQQQQQTRDASNASPAPSDSSSSQQQQQLQQREDESNLRPIVVDGSDVGFSESTATFELARIKAVVDYFEKRRHKIFVLLPLWRKDQILASPNARRANSPSATTPSTTSPTGGSSSPPLSTSSGGGGGGNDAAEELDRMMRRGILHYTPIRVPSKNKYQEDSAILELAKKKNAVIVSNDTYKKFVQDEKYKELIDERVLPYTIIEDEFLPSLSSLGNTLENFLRFEPIQDSKFNKKCPYMQRNRCTFGAKCKYWHPERGPLQAMGPNQGGSQMKTTHQKVVENVSQNKMRFQIILNETLENQISNNNERPAAKSSVDVSSSSSSSLTSLRQQSQLTSAAAASTNQSNNLVSRIERFSLIDGSSSSSGGGGGGATSGGPTAPSADHLVQSIITNTIGEQQKSTTTASSQLWWSHSGASTAAAVSVTNTTKSSSSSSSNRASPPTPTAAQSSRDEARRQLEPYLTPEQIDQVLSAHPDETDPDTLMYYANEMFEEF